MPHIMSAVLSILNQFRPSDVLTAAAEALRPLLATSSDAFGGAVAALLPAEAWTAELQQQAAGHVAQMRAAAADPGTPMRAFEAAFAEFVGLLRGAMHRK